MTQLGADPVQLRNLAAQFRAEAGLIRESAQSVTTELAAAWWRGEDCDRFTDAWHGEHAKTLNGIAAMLQEVAVGLDNEATAQERTSY